MKYLRNHSTTVASLSQDLYLKCEWQNLTGTPKSRFVSTRLANLRQRGEIESGMMLYDVSTGSEAAALAQYGAIEGYPVHVWLPDYVDDKFVDYIRRFGTKVDFVDGDNWLAEGAVAARQAAAKDSNGFYFNQADALEDAIKAYSTSGREFGHQLKEGGIIPAAIISVIGSGGLLLGNATGLSEIFPDIQIYAIELDAAPYMHAAKYCYNPNIHSHHVWGIASEGSTRMKEELLVMIDDVVLITKAEMNEETKKMPRTEGISVDYPTASNIIGARRLIEQDIKPVATIWTGHGWRTL